ncbi:uncharacterized protein N7482_009186 [Penicillium canariense]|uniref:N-acetyltransferase domain-containing protein n=1 Tax=Penicillium canariense TaxID=189055 RepID=A0A9W9LFL4_9EURO|nr:uncharacterized protein N7482_009186 [Penicillium canariense]KAJ5152708.1 hypothetical protein N7482_009186 [Penicillium canariense]
MSPRDCLAQCPGLSGLNAFVRPLSVADVKSCVVVESTFPEHERCSEEKFRYRLTMSPELSLGLFLKTENGDRHIGHVIGNKLSSNSITESSMHMPANWESQPANEPCVLDGQTVGHDPKGENLAIHSVVTIPEFQGRGIGKALVKAYIAFVRQEEIPAKNILLIAHDYLIKFYESAGFENHGPSACQFAGGGWYDLPESTISDWALGITV